MSSPRIVVFAYSGLGHACLEYLLKSKANVTGVYTHRDNPHEHIWFSSVAELAKKNKVPFFMEEHLSSSSELERIRQLKPDLIFSFYYRNLIPLDVLRLARLGAFNIHGSYLPKYRGRAPVNWAILNGETATGVTLHEMVEKADAGAIVDQIKIGIGPDETAAQVQEKITQGAVELLRKQWPLLSSGKVNKTAQMEPEATYFGRRQPKDGEISWDWPAKKIHNYVRGLTHPYPGAQALLDGRCCILWKTKRVELGRGPRWTESCDPGQIVRDKKQLFVACGDQQWIEVLSLQYQGEKEMLAADLKKEEKL